MNTSQQAAISYKYLFKIFIKGPKQIEFCSGNIDAIFFFVFFKKIKKKSKNTEKPETPFVKSKLNSLV